jgi:hypothetical protein
MRWQCVVTNNKSWVANLLYWYAKHWHFEHNWQSTNNTFHSFWCCDCYLSSYLHTLAVRSI